MTIHEYKKALYNLSDEQFSKFNIDFGGGDKTRDQRVTEFVRDPQHERLICQLLVLVTQEERLAQASLRSSHASIIATITALLAIVLTIVNIWISNTAGKRQLELSVTPRIQVLPNEEVQGKDGEFDLQLANRSPVTLLNVRVYEDYFVSLTPPGGGITCHRFGIFSTKPDSVIGRLEAKDTKAFKISIKSVHDDMSEFYTGEAKGHRMMIVRLTFEFDREIDGAEYAQSKAYVIAGNGECLLDYDERGMGLSGGPTFRDIKNALGVSIDWQR